MTVAIAIDAVADDVFRQHLNLPDLAGPGAGTGCGIEVAVLHHLDECEQLRTEEFGAAAVVGERHESIAGVEIALDGAEVCFHGPESGNDAGRYAELALGARERIGILLQLLPADVQSGLAHRSLRKLQEGLLEDTLRAVAGENLPVDRRTGQGLVGHLCGYAPGGGFGLHTIEKGPEITAARLRHRGRGEARQGEYGHCHAMNKGHSKAPCVGSSSALDTLCDGRAATDSRRSAIGAGGGFQCHLLAVVTQSCQFFCVPAKTLMSVLPLTPGTTPVAVYCQKAQRRDE